MKQEAANGTAIIPLANFKARLIAATKISESSYRRIAKEASDVASGAVPCFSTPGKNRKRDCPKSKLCDGEIETIRSIIHNFYIIEKSSQRWKGL
jgi:hypothetical protein